MLKVACGGGGTSTKAGSDYGTRVTGAETGEGDGENLIPTPLITFCNRPIFPCLVSKSKMAKTFWRKQTIKTKQTYQHRQGMVIHPGKNHQKFEGMYLLGNFALWSSCNDGGKCITKCDAREDRWRVVVLLSELIPFFAFVRFLMKSFFLTGVLGLWRRVFLLQWIKKIYS